MQSHFLIPPNPELVDEDEPTCERYRGAYATPYTRIDGNTFGALYSRDGKLIKLSQRPSGKGGDTVKLADPDEIPTQDYAKKIPGRGCYIGHLMGHYGHFITEALSCLWAIKRGGANEFDYYAAHSFAFGSTLPPFARDFYDLMGIETKKIRRLRKPTLLDDVVVPQRLWHTNFKVNAEFRRLISPILRKFQSNERHLRLYLSRGGTGNRAITNEREIEKVFASRGFVVIQPEQLSVAEQLSLYGRAAMISGLSGSALHNVIFCPHGVRVIALGDRRFPKRLIPNQTVCNALSGAETILIPFAGSDEQFDIEYLSAELEAALR